MSNNATYINNTIKTANVKNSSISKSIVTLMFLATIVLGSVIGTFATATKVKADDHPFDPVQFVMCFFGKSSIPGKMYEASNTDKMEFELRSKSSISKGIDIIDSGDNWMLEATGSDFIKTNESILNRKIKDSESTSDGSGDSKNKTTTDNTTGSNNTTTTGKYNGGAQVNPYDRFGVAGLTFTSYQGEWKYIVVDACNPDADPQDPKTGLYYTDRMVPQTTWEGIDTTRDIRSMQVKKGYITTLMSAFMNTISNIIFSVSKFIVAVALSLINFAFADLVKVMGLDSFLTGDSGHDGVFNSLFKGLFTPLIVIAITLTGVNIAYHGIVKRAYRQSMIILARTILLFFMSIVISLKPAQYIAIPNNISIAVQAVMVEAMSDSLTGKDGLCATNVAKVGKTSDDQLVKKGKDDKTTLADISTNMRSTLDCTMWEELLFKPWAQGQYGSDWNKTWAKGKTPAWADKNTSAEFTINQPAAKIVGDAEVPLGGGTKVNNWALFQLSTQTNVHAPLGANGQPSKITSGVSNDWWRVVDILSGYNEKQVHVAGNNKDTYITPDETSKPLDEWNRWIGDSAGSRMLTALSSVFVAIIGVLAPLVFSAYAAIYTIGLAILMALSPIMLLFGCWAGKGWEIFKGWGELVVNTTLKRIACGVLLVLSFLFTTTAIKFMQTDGWWSGILMMMVLSYLVIKMRHKIFDTLASIQFATANFSGTAKKLTAKTKAPVKFGQQAGKMVAMGTISGISSKTHGGSFAAGANAGSREQLRNMAYRSKFARQVMIENKKMSTQMNGKTSENLDEMTCISCNDTLTNGDTIGVTKDGGYLCSICLNDSEDPDMEIVEMDWSTLKEQARIKKEAQRAGGDQINPGYGSRQRMNSAVTKRQVNDAKKANLDKEARLNNVAKIADSINKDMDEHIKSHGLTNVDEDGNPIVDDKKRMYDKDGNRLQKRLHANIPDEIAKYVDTVLINDALDANKHQFVQEYMTIAWAHWLHDNFTEFAEDKIEDILRDIRYAQENDNTEP